MAAPEILVVLFALSVARKVEAEALRQLAKLADSDKNARWEEELETSRRQPEPHPPKAGEG